METKSKTKILLTGGAGFIGSALALKLIELNYDLVILDCLNSQIHHPSSFSSSLFVNKIQKNVEFIKGNVESRDAIQRSLKGVNWVIHLAAETGTGQSMYEIDKYVQANITGTSTILDSLRKNKHKVEKFLVASSRAIYGEGRYLSKEIGAVYPDHRKIEDMVSGDFEVKYPNCTLPLIVSPTDEDSKIHPSSVYGITKQVQEQLVMNICPTLGIKPIALRYQNVFGPGQSLSNPYTGILSIFSTLLLEEKEVNIFEDGNESRDFVYIDDVVNATIQSLEQEQGSGGIFNVGSGVGVRVIEVAEGLKNLYQSTSKITISGNFRIGDIRHNIADISKITQATGFKPQYTFKQGLRIFSEWVKLQALPESGYEKSLEEMKEKGLFK